MRAEGTNETQAEMACHGQCMAPPARSDPSSHPGDGEDGHGLNCAVDSDIGGHDCTGQSVVRCLTAFVSGDPRRRSDCLADPQRRLRPRRSMVRLWPDQRGARPVWAMGTLVIFLISERDAIWHTRVLESKIEYNEAEREEWIEIYRNWLRASERLLPSIARLEGQGFEVRGADEFRRNCDEARG